MLLLEAINVGLLQMVKDHKHIAIVYCVNLTPKKSWVDNLLPKVAAIERNHQHMCQLMCCITECTLNAMCEEVMQ